MPVCSLSEWSSSRVLCKEYRAVNLTGFFFEFATECSSALFPLQQLTGLTLRLNPAFVPGRSMVNQELAVDGLTVTQTETGASHSHD